MEKVTIAIDGIRLDVQKINSRKLRVFGQADIATASALAQREQWLSLSSKGGEPANIFITTCSITEDYADIEYELR